VELTLEPLTVLVGPNSAGKTSALHAIHSFNGMPLSPADFWRGDTSQSISVEWFLRNAHSFEFASDTNRQALSRRVHASESAYRMDENSIGTSQSLSLNLASLRSENLLARAQRLSGRGENITNVFASLTRKEQESVAQELCRLVSMFSDVDAEPTEKGKHQLRFQDRWNPKLWLSPNEVSDGTMLLLAFIVLQYQTPQMGLITIEEPERALHPYLLGELIQILRKMTTGEIGKNPVQVVLATHSAELLEYVRPEEVRFLTRSPEDGSVQVNQASTKSANWRRVYEEYKQSLGSIWLSGGMGGVPGE
jgi:predicted ATPase